MFSDRGGDVPGVENSTTSYRFVNPEDAACPHCGNAPRALGTQVRPLYEGLSGHDPAGLLTLPKYKAAA